MHGKVVRVAAFGAFIDIAEGIEGLCHNSEAADDKGTPIKFEPGQEFDFKIVKMNPEEKKIGLSIRAVGEEASRAEVEAYKQPAASIRVRDRRSAISSLGSAPEATELRRTKRQTPRRLVIPTDVDGPVGEGWPEPYGLRSISTS